LKKTLIVFVAIIISSTSWSQNIRISGFVSEYTSRERLISSTIFESSSKSGVLSDNNGFYSLLVPSGKVALKYTFIGYKPLQLELTLSHDTVINAFLDRSIEKIDEVLVTEQRLRNKLESKQVSIERLPLSTIKQIPALIGETDILKTLQLLPGIQSGSEGLSSLYVRGGGSDQNLILLDGVPVYNPFHLFGFLSFFNPEAINDISIMKGGFPAWYGGRVSSVVDITMKDGNADTFHSNLNIGLISSKIMIEGPIIKDKSSFLVTARRSMVDIFLKPIIGKKTPDYLFYDATLKLNYSFSSRNRIYLTLFTGEDKIGDKTLFEEITLNDINYFQTSNQKYGWGNIAASARWNYIASNKLVFDTQINFSRYRYNDSYDYNFQGISKDSTNKRIYSFKHYSGIREAELKHQLSYYASNHFFKAGISINSQRIDPDFNGIFSKSSANVTTNDTILGDYAIKSTNYTVFINDEISISNKIGLNIGLRHTGYFVQRKYYLSTEPRVSVSYHATSNLTFKSAFSLSSQYIQLLPSSNIFLPTDLWVPVTKDIKPMISNQIVLATVYKPAGGNLLFTIEGYYKNFKNLIEYKEGASLLGYYYDLIDRIETGTGKAYGIEFLLEKPKGPTTGWVGYTLAWSNRRFETINQGKPFPYKFDRRHNISIVVQHRLNKHLDMNMNWVFGTGQALTLSYEKYPSFFNPLLQSEFLEGQHFLDDETIKYFNEKNNYRLPAYHRLDIGFNWNINPAKNHHLLSFGLYNAYNRLNAFSVYYGGGKKHSSLKKYTLFPILPYISYTYRF